MKLESVNPISAAEFRCHHRYPNGSRCRLPVPGPDARFCRRHAQLPQNHAEAAELAATLTAGLSEFRTAEDINEFLSRLLMASAQDRISPRRAAVLTYITSQLLRTIAAMDRKDEAAGESKPRAIYVWDIPRPAHEHPVSG